MKNINLSEEQFKVLEDILKWYKKTYRKKSFISVINPKKYITLGGYAGTGKTTLLAKLRGELQKIYPDNKVAFCTFTGKASEVLKNKLKEQDSIFPKDKCGTIHSLIYKPIEKDDVIIGWEQKQRKEVQADLIIIDEASMVSEKIFINLLAYEIPILAEGDIGQLPPINDKFNLMEEPDLKLKRIHRQAEDNPIIKLSTEVRKGNFKEILEEILNNTNKEDTKNIKAVTKYTEESRELLDSKIEEFNNEKMFLCAYNNTRIKLNTYIRKKLEFINEQPQIGDRVICLRNNHKKGIYNGMLGEILEIKEKNKEWYTAKIKMDGGYIFKGPILKAQFGAKSSLNMTMNRKKTMKGDLFDYGYCITVHKSQGSEAKEVILFNENLYREDKDMQNKWLYTAVTRAKENLIIVN